MKTRANAAYIDEAINNISGAGPLYGRDDLLPQCLRLHKQAKNLKYKKGIGAAGRVIARILMSLARYGEAKPYLDESLKVLSLLKERDDLFFNVVLLQSEMETARGNHDAALKNTSDLMAGYLNKMSPERYAGCYLNMGTICLAKGLLYHALYNYQQIISRKDEFRHVAPFNSIWMSYANVLKYLHLYDESLEQFLAILKETNPANIWHRFHANMNIANIYAGKFKDYPSSKKYMDECLRLADPETHPDLHAIALSNHGTNLMAVGKYAEAIPVLTDKRVLKSVASSRGDQAAISVNIASCLLQANKVKEAAVYLEQTEGLLAGNGMLLQKIQHYNNSFIYYSFKKNYTEAWRYHRLHQGALDESHRMQSKLQAQQLNALIGLERKQKELEVEKLHSIRAQREIEFARQQNALMQTNIEQRNTLIDEFHRAIRKMELTDAKRRDIFKELHEKISTVRRTNIEMSAYDIKHNTTHHAQVSKLQMAYPSITAGEAKIAIMLASGLGNKEIAGITLTTQRNIETQRLRLRKKMHLKTEDNLLQMLRKAVE